MTSSRVQASVEQAEACREHFVDMLQVAAEADESIRLRESPLDMLREKMAQESTCSPEVEIAYQSLQLRYLRAEQAKQARWAPAHIGREGARLSWQEAMEQFERPITHGDVARFLLKITRRETLQMLRS